MAGESDHTRLDLDAIKSMGTGLSNIKKAFDGLEDLGSKYDEDFCDGDLRDDVLLFDVLDIEAVHLLPLVEVGDGRVHSQWPPAAQAVGLPCRLGIDAAASAARAAPHGFAPATAVRRR